jgi:hypothetical protein
MWEYLELEMYWQVVVVTLFTYRNQKINFLVCQVANISRVMIVSLLDVQL